MNYILKQFDEPLVKFSATTDTSEPEIQILWTNVEKAAFLPLPGLLPPFFGPASDLHRCRTYDLINTYRQISGSATGYQKIYYLFF